MARKDRHRIDPARVESLAADLLAGRTRADAQRLLELIHAVNPTGQELPAAERERRYQVKARLQSLLLRDFRDDVQVRPDPRAPDTVTLWHRYAGLDACHAVVPQLDEDSRSWVRWQLDVGEPLDEPARDHTGPTPPATSTAARSGDDAAERVARGREALEAYDFEAARDHLMRALELSHGGFAAAVPLLELLIEHLASYRDALAVAPVLSAEAAARPRVRALLAMAAARCSERRMAARLLKGLEDVGAAEVLVVLTADAAAAGEVEEAQRYLAELRERDPAHPELVRLAADVERTRSTARQPLEDELRRTVERGEVTEAERQARTLLARWPDSAVAKRTLAQLEARARREAATARVTEAQSALDRGELGRAANLARQARALGGGSDELEALVTAAETAARRDAQRAQVDAVIRRHATGATPDADALLAYLALDEGRRRAVRQATRSEPLERLEQARASHARERADTLAAAILALSRADALLTAGAGQEAVLAVVAPHEKVLGAVPHARALLGRAREKLRAARQAAALAALDAVRAAVAAGDGTKALSLLAQLDGRALPHASRDALPQLESEARHCDEIRWRGERVTALADTDPLAARAEAARLVALTAGAEQAAWAARCDELAQSARRAFRLRVVDARSLPGADELAAAVADLHGETATLLDPVAGEVLTATVRHQWVFVSGLDAASGTCRRLAALRTPTPLGVVTAQVVPGALWLIGTGGAALELGLPDLDLRRWQAGGAVPPDEAFDIALVAPGGRYLWLISTGRQLQQPGSTRVVDLERGGVRRELRSCFKLVALPAATAPRVACLEVAEAGRLHEVDGTRAERPLFPRGARIDGIALDPAGAGWLVLGWDLTASAQMTIVRVNGEALAGGWGVPGPEADAGADFLTARGARLALVHFDTGEGESEVVVLDASGEALVERYRTRVSHATVLVHDPAGERVLALTRTAAGLALIELGPDALAVPIWEGPEGGLPRVRPPFYGCDHCVGLELLESSAQLARAPVPEQEARVRAWRATGADGVEPAAGLAFALWEAGQRDRAVALVTEELTRHSGHPVLTFLRAEWAATEGRWEEVRRLLAGAVPGALTEGQTRHCHHLLGCAYLHLGEVEAARRAWEEGLRGADRGCQLDECLELVTPLPAPLLASDWGEDQPVLRQILGAIRTADQCLAVGETTAARRALWREAVLARGELQSLARLAEASLRDDPADDLAWFRATYALAAFLDARAERHPATQVVIPGATWDETRLADVSARARAWLDGVAAGETHEAAPPVAIAWYLPEQWDRLRQISADRDALEATHGEWHGVAEATVARLQTAGTRVDPVTIDVSELEAWCQAQGVPVDARSRSRYAAARHAELAQRRGPPWTG